MAVRPTASISSITFSGGQKFAFKPNEKIVLVGPNNSGKSQTLREILRISSANDTPQLVVLQQLEIAKLGSADDLKNFLKDHAEILENGFRYKSWNLSTGQTPRWNQANFGSALAGGYIQNIGAENRLQICKHQKSIGPADQKSKPQHFLYDDSSLMEMVSHLFHQAFGQDIMFDFRGGQVLPIHVGDKPDPKLRDRVGEPYVAAVRTNPLLSEQGDGMKSYAGILFETIVSDLDINLLDEPEAFLHPPQMRRLGATLASEVKGQLIVATHSSDILRGFLEGTNGDVRILRIRREGNRNLVSEAAPEVIQELWARPELKYSNALEGIFHEETILCEDESDCRLINAMADHLDSNEKDRWKDTVYVPTGGKHGIKKIAKVLRKIGVPIKAVFDIDFLSERSLVEETVKAFGGRWEDISEPWKRVDAAVRKGVKTKSVDEIKQELFTLIQNCAEGQLPRKDINEAMKQTSAWNLVKKFGQRGIPNGNAQSDYQELKELLQEIGIYLVHVGEVENFCPDLGSHGPKFVNNLLTNVQLDDPRLKDLREFVAVVHKGNHAPLDSGATPSPETENITSDLEPALTNS